MTDTTTAVELIEPDTDPRQTLDAFLSAHIQIVNVTWETR